MFFPIRTDRRLHHVPWVNVSIIAANVVVFLLTDMGQAHERMAPYMLYPASPRLPQFISYQFLHANFLHLAGNMLFLYVFGNHVEDRLGKAGYLGFYLSGGVLAALGHVLLEPAPVLGASGAVSAMTGAYLALFPMTNVTIGYWFFFIGTFEVSSLVMILFQIGQNVFFHFANIGQPVAYMAHLWGYAFGFLVAIALLAGRLLPREPYDLLSMWEHRRRRAQFAAMTRQGYQPWDAPVPREPDSRNDAPALSAKDQRLMTLRSQIASAMTAQRYDDAAQVYDDLLRLDPGQVLSQQAQVDLANHLMAQQRYELAAKAYELFLNTYRSYSQREQVELVLALIYTRYLTRRQRAQELLTSALPRLRDPAQREFAEHLRQELDSPPVNSHPPA